MPLTFTQLAFAAPAPLSDPTANAPDATAPTNMPPASFSLPPVIAL